MDERGENASGAEARLESGGCCCRDPHADLPAELRPRPPAKDDGLRRVTCPGCGLEYWTNRKTDVCALCENAGPPKV